MSTNTKLPSKHREEKQSYIATYFMMIFVVVLGGIVYQVYIAAAPTMPEIDTKEWWGPYPINMDPDESIRPYKFEFPDVIVNDLKERLLHRRPFVPPVEGSGFKFGFNTNFLTTVLDYWQNNYDFKERENFFNKYDHYITNIQGLDIHYIHVKPKVAIGVDVLPIMLIHNWPSSFREFYEIIPTLTTQQPGQDFVCEVIVPSLPGFGFSQAPSRSGMGPIAISVILRNLMLRIGHDEFYIHGADFGQSIGSALATAFPENVLGFHASMPLNTYSMSALWQKFWGRITRFPYISIKEKDRVMSFSDTAQRFYENYAYIWLQATKPDTIGIALSESPAGLAAYILEKFSLWTNLENIRANDGGLIKKFMMTHLLDNVMIYWVSNSITTSMRPYTQYHTDMAIIDRITTVVPTCGIKFKNELYFEADAAVRLKYVRYIRTKLVEDGGHFPAMELPQVLAQDINEAMIAFQKYWEKRKEERPKLRAIRKGPTVYDYTVKDIHGREVSLNKYRGKVLIIVNVASKCGYTNTHYEQLNQLYEKYKDRDLRILAFPCNQFGGQEPGTLKDILQFTKEKNVQFDVFEKIDVNGDDAHPLWQYLKQAQRGTIGDFIKWNFSKFIIDRNGVPVERFGPNVDPLDLEPYLDKYF